MGMSELPISRRGILGAAMVGAVGLVAGFGQENGGQAAPGGSQAPSEATPGSATSPATSPTSTTTPAAPASPADIAARAVVPVLCYHQVRPYEGGDTSYTKQLLVVEPAAFGRQLDAIKGAGYTTISPDQYQAHLTTGAALPERPVILSFDDGKDNQVSRALPALVERGMTGTWFIMSVVIGNSGWTTKAQIKEMAEAGITIGCHTYDHHDVRKYTAKDFRTQFVDARKTLQDHSGQPVETFAFPYGAWNPAALPPLEKAGFTTAFQLDEKPLDRERPLMTLRRSLAVSDWSGDQVVEKLGTLSKRA